MVKIICYVQYRDMNYFLGERKYEKLLYAKCSFVQSIEKCPINVVWEQSVQHTGCNTRTDYMTTGELKRTSVMIYIRPFMYPDD